MSFPSFSVGEVLTAADMNAVGLWRVTTCTVTSVGGTAATASNGVITIGTGNTEVTVSNAFSADWLNYRIIFTGGTASQTNNLQFQLSGITGATAYRQLGNYQAWGSSTITPYASDGSTALVAHATTGGYSWCVDIRNPFDTKVKFADVSGLSATSQYWFPTYINSTSSASGFKLLPTAGTLTGGTIRVYGYRN